MTGTILKRADGVYLIRVSLGHDTVTAKRLRHTETFRGTKKQADARLRKLVDEFESGGSLVKVTTKSINEVIELWLGAVKNKIRERTHQDYTWLWEHFVKGEKKDESDESTARKTKLQVAAKLKPIGQFPAGKLQTSMIQTLYNALSEDGVSPSTTRKLHSVLIQALRMGVRQKMLPRNVADDVELPRLAQRRKSRALPIETAKAFLLASAEHYLGCAFRFGLESGCRPQEYFAVGWEDLDWTRGLVRIDKAVCWLVGKPPFIDETKNEGSCRTIVLSPQLQQDLKRHRNRQLQARLSFGEEWKGDGKLIFVNSFGAMVSRTVYKKAFTSILKTAGLEDLGIRPYDLRASCCTLMSQVGVPVKVASERMGHVDTRMTLDTYTGVISSQEEQATQALAKVLYPEPVQRLRGPGRRPRGPSAVGLRRSSPRVTSDPSCSQGIKLIPG